MCVKHLQYFLGAKGASKHGCWCLLHVSGEGHEDLGVSWTGGKKSEAEVRKDKIKDKFACFVVLSISNPCLNV